MSDGSAQQAPAGVAGGLGPRPIRPEDRWILSRLQRSVDEISRNLDSYDFAHAALEGYRFIWSELCDWYLEIAKPRLYDGEQEVAATLLWVLEQTLALIHPMMPFVTEEIWSYHPAREGHLAVHPYPEASEELIDAEAEAEVGDAIELTRRLRAWREMARVDAKSVLRASIEGEIPPEFVGRLAQFEFSTDGGDPVASVGPVQVLATDELDPEAIRERIEARRTELRSEVERAQRNLANQGFVEGAPPEVVEEEREKLARYQAELEELEQ